MARALYHPNASHVETWVEEQREHLYTGHARDLISALKALKLSLSARAKRDASKREALSELINYLQKRLAMMASYVRT